MPFVSVTRLRLRSVKYLIPFWRYAIPSDRQARHAAGNLATATRRTAGNAFWTLTVWDSEAAMRRYMTSGSHRKAMPKLAEWCDEASTAHWQQDGTELPRWEYAEQYMVTHGRLHPVKQPSAAHAAGIIKL